jgi:glycosyltransferase involved in cell wall biosynthesis
MEEVVLGTGVAADKLHRIPIGIDVEAFPLRTDADRSAAREVLGLPESAFVVGSFQKDGVGWGDGLEPKLIKGPDVLLAAAERLRDRVPELTFLLTGPSRGYVRAGLDGLGIPYRHVLLPDVDLDRRTRRSTSASSLRATRAGRAVLEAMATGAARLRAGRPGGGPRRDGGNGARRRRRDALVDRAAHVATAPAAELERVLEAGRSTAEESSYVALRPRWRELLTGFVALPGPSE